MSTKLIQGDSLWLDITGDVASQDPDWNNWTGHWAIVPTIGGTPAASDTLIKTATIGKFRLQVSTTVSAGLSVGNYFLVVQVENVTADYRKEIAQEKLVVQAQGITP